MNKPSLSKMKLHEENEMLKVFLETKKKLQDPKEIEEKKQRQIQEKHLKKLFLKKLRREGFYSKQRSIVSLLLIIALGLPLSAAAGVVFVLSKGNISLLILLLVPVISFVFLIEIIIKILFDISEMRLKESVDNFDYSKVNQLL